MRQTLPSAQILLNGCNDFKACRQRSSGRCVTLASYREYANAWRQRVGAAASGPRLCQEKEEQGATREKRGDAGKYARHRSGAAPLEMSCFKEMIGGRTRGGSRLECCSLPGKYLGFLTLMDVYDS